jgi:DNA-binding MarR family transcriptional regulator
MSAVYVDLFKTMVKLEDCAASFKQGTSIDDLSLVQIHILHELFTEDGRKASDLARSVGRAATSFTPLLDSLEQRKLVVRKAAPNDRRAISIFLTPVAMTMKADVQLVVHELNRAFGHVGKVIQS